MRKILFLVAVSLTHGGCASFGEADDKALIAAQASASLSTLRADEFRAYVLASDARQRVSLERELDLIVQVAEAEAETRFAAEIAAASAAAPSTRPAGVGVLDDGAPALRVVEVGAVARLVAAQAAERAALRAAVAAKRKEITAQLDRERDAWLSDPKAREAERINASLVAYASARSEMARFVREITGGGK